MNCAQSWNDYIDRFFPAMLALKYVVSPASLLSLRPAFRWVSRDILRYSWNPFPKAHPKFSLFGRLYIREAGIPAEASPRLSLTKIPCGLPQMPFSEAKRKALADRGPV